MTPNLFCMKEVLKTFHVKQNTMTHGEIHFIFTKLATIQQT